MHSLLFLIVCIFFKLIIADYTKPIISEVDQIINTITEKKTVKYISNGIELKTTLEKHYFDILDMEISKMYDYVMILEQVKKQQQYYQEDLSIGYKTRCESIDIKLAENYIIDNYNYIVNLN